MATFVNSDKSSGESKAPEEAAGGDASTGVFWAATPSGLFKKVGTGGAWTAQGNPGLKTIEVAGSNAEHLVGVTEGGDAKYSGDGGATWQDVPKWEDKHKMVAISISDDASKLWAVCENQKIIHAASGVAGGWQSIPGKTDSIHLSGDGGHMICDVKGAGFVRPGLAGKWIKLGAPEGKLKQACIANDKTVWGVTEDGNCWLHDGAWKKVLGREFQQIHVSGSGSHIVVLRENGNAYYRSSIQGAWTDLGQPGEGCTCVSVTAVTVDPAAIAAAEAAFAALLAAKAAKDSAAGAATAASADAATATAAATTAKAAAAAAKAEWERLEAEASAAEAAASEKAAGAAASATASGTAQTAFTEAVKTALSTAAAALCSDDPKYAEYK